VEDKNDSIIELLVTREALEISGQLLLVAAIGMGSGGRLGRGNGTLDVGNDRRHCSIAASIGLASGLHDITLSYNL
jgi:hypothetical protein